MSMSECGKVHGPNWKRWLGHLAGKPDVHGMEIGTFQADSAVWMLENIFTHPQSTYTCVDPFLPEGSAEHKQAGIDCTKNEKIARERLSVFGKKCIILKWDSRCLLKYLRQIYQFIYVDGDHTAPAVLRDSVQSFELLSVGGVLVWDDYEWRVMRDQLLRPQPAIDAFLNIYQKKITVLDPKGWQIAIRKNHE